MATILIIDDNDTVRDGLSHVIKKMVHDALASARDVVGVVLFGASRGVHLVIHDLKNDTVGTIIDLRALAASGPHVPVMIITGFVTVETAVEAMQLGAFDFLT